MNIYRKQIFHIKQYFLIFISYFKVYGFHLIIILKFE